MNQNYRHNTKAVQQGYAQKRGFQAKRDSNSRLTTEMNKKDPRNSIKKWSLHQKQGVGHNLMTQK